MTKSNACANAARKAQLIEDLVQIFAEENSFVSLIDVLALGDTTRNQWNAQLNAALETIRDGLAATLESVEEQLHDGEFAAACSGPKCNCGASSCEGPDEGEANTKESCRPVFYRGTV
jgi:hypothetical protein